MGWYHVNEPKRSGWRYVTHSHQSFAAVLLWYFVSCDLVVDCLGRRNNEDALSPVCPPRAPVSMIFATSAVKFCVIVYSRCPHLVFGCPYIYRYIYYDPSNPFMFCCSTWFVVNFVFLTTPRQSSSVDWFCVAPTRLVFGDLIKPVLLMLLPSFCRLWWPVSRRAQSSPRRWPSSRHPLKPRLEALFLRTGTQNRTARYSSSNVAGSWLTEWITGPRWDSWRIAWERGVVRGNERQQPGKAEGGHATAVIWSDLICFVSFRHSFCREEPSWCVSCTRKGTEAFNVDSSLFCVDVLMMVTVVVMANLCLFVFAFFVRGDGLCCLSVRLSVRCCRRLVGFWRERQRVLPCPLYTLLALFCVWLSGVCCRCCCCCDGLLAPATATINKKYKNCFFFFLLRIMCVCCVRFFFFRPSLPSYMHIFTHAVTHGIKRIVLPDTALLSIHRICRV